MGRIGEKEDQILGGRNHIIISKKKIEREMS